MPAPDVRVRLSAEGVQEIVAALRKIRSEADSAATKTSRSFAGLNSVLASTQRFFAAFGIAIGVAQLVKFTAGAVEAADANAKLAQRLGTTTENASALAVSAKLANIEIAALDAGIGFLAKRLQQLRLGDAATRGLFRRLGLSAGDFKSRDVVEAFAVVSKAVSGLRDDGAKMVAVMELLGARTGRQLVPLMRELADEGLEGARRRAQSLGLLLDRELASSMQQLADNTLLLRLRLVGAATQFAAGFSPAAVQTLTDIAGEAGGAADSFRELGEQLGRAFRLLLPIINIVDFAQNRAGRIGVQLAGIAAAIGAVLRLDFKQAAQIEENTRIVVNRLDAELAERLERRRKAFEKPIAKPPTVETGGGAAVADDEQAAEERARRELDRQERLRNEVLGFQRQILEAQGQRHAAALQQIEEEAAKFREALEGQRDAAGRARPAAEVEALVQQFRSAKTAAAEFNAALEVAQAQLGELERARKALREEAERGIVTDEEAARRVLALERERAGALDAFVRAAERAAAATGDPEAIARAAALRDQLIGLGQAARVAGESVARDFAGRARSALESFLTGTIDQVRTLTDLFRELGRIGAQAFRDIFAARLAGQVERGLAGALPGFWNGGWVERFGMGGIVRGPGSGTSDSIIARLSNGEYVIRAGVAAQPGMREYLDMMNSGRGLEFPVPHVTRRVDIPRYADGGPVEIVPRGGAAPPPAAAARLDGELVIRLADGLVSDGLLTPDSQRNLIKVVGTNSRAMRRALGLG